ncbi:MAG TPA: RNA polymerase sigma factor [Gemmatimonadaceae bacterium]|nr:RNA polymerase sigma factor [Gemmatimonadaceae bacterium]
MEVTAQPVAEEPTDAELIRRWRIGEGMAATRLVERHAPGLARFVAAEGERDNVDEVVQDTFVRAFAAIDSFRGESAFRTWLFTIARRLILDRRRSERRSRMVATVEEGDAVTTFDALDTMVADESMVRVRMAVDALSQKQKEVFMLRLEQGLSYKEIAELVGTTEGAARVHYHNAMRAVKEFLDDE